MAEETSLDEYFFADAVTTAQMDYLWAHGWRHFGMYFFRYATLAQTNEILHVEPLRIRLADFTLSTSQKRVFKKNKDLRLAIREAALDDVKEALFERHKTRFTENVPDSIYDFFSPLPSEIPCVTKELCLYREDTLVAASFLDIGAEATSSVYSIYEPTESGRSLGVYLILLSIAYAKQLGKRFYYHGYAYREPSHYDYKKRFRALEYYDWERWNPYHFT